jgi:hypothetical protein
MPGDVFKEQGTRICTDILFLKKRAPGDVVRHADTARRHTQPVAIEEAEIPIDRYFLHHPEMLLCRVSHHDRLYAAGYSVEATGKLNDSSSARYAACPKASPPPYGRNRAGEGKRHLRPRSRHRRSDGTSLGTARSSATTT